MNYEKDLVSVIMPTYKRADKLDRAIKSVLGQTYKKLELILVNDNNPDDKYSRMLVQIVDKYKSDSRFRFICQRKHINGAVARNLGIKNANGEFIAFLDDDDWWKAEKIERQICELKSRTDEWGGVSCRIQQYNNDKEIAKLPKYEDGYIYKDILMLKSDIATGTLLLRHSYLDDVGYFDEKLLRHQDLQLLVNFTFKYKLYQLDEFLHCCDVSDTMNRPDGEKLIQFKSMFFQSVASVMNSLSDRERRCVYCINNFEIAYVFLKDRNYRKAIRYGVLIFRSPKAILLAIKKIFSKVKNKI
ncbi:MAG TPA: glycosyltransferase [Candidatus Mediterraneibacter surreyensis]|nr:glycosyltransferase [Candidatus Mediterraneibacter surreyensis]